MPDLAPIRRALVSVSEKSGLLGFVQSLAQRGVEIISTGGTAEHLRKDGVKVTPIEAVTGFPELLSGRVKTLHPLVHGGLLGLRDDPVHAAQMKQHNIAPIDLVCVNLYPFEHTIAKQGCTREDAIEHIDIGGPSMVRSAAKNHAFVTVVTHPSQYARVEEELARHLCATTRALREDFAAQAFALTARYDAAIAAYMAVASDSPFPPLLTVSLVKGEDLRYGENPHQRAALYKRLHRADHETPAPTIPHAEQLHGKELSYNNIHDAASALELVLALERITPRHAGACVVKHANPCGASVAPGASGVRDAVHLAILGDPLAAYGGILAVNTTLDAPAAERIADRECFFEVIVAPEFAPDALDVLRSRWTNVRLLRTGHTPAPAHSHSPLIDWRSIPGGILAQERDRAWCAPSSLTHRAGPAATRDHLRAALFLEAVGRFLMSNAVVLGGPVSDGEVAPGSLRMFGGGAGQMDRLTSCKLAVEKSGALSHGAVAYSDAFFPFADGPEVLVAAGVACIVHPGGSKRDQETFDLCNQRAVTCLTTGIRHFRH